MDQVNVSYSYFQSDEIAFQTVPNEDGLVVEDPQQIPLYITDCCFNRLQITLSYPTEAGEN